MPRARVFLAILALASSAAPLARAAATIVTGTDAGVAPHVRAFDAGPLDVTASYFAYNAAFTGGVRVAAADFDADGVADHLVGPGGGGGPQVQIFDGTTQTPLASYFAFAPSYLGGVFVAAGDVTHDGRPDVVAATASGAGQVRVFDALSDTVVRDFAPFGASFAGGLSVAAGDVDGDGYADIVAAPVGPGFEPEVRVISGFDGSVLRDFYAFPRTFTGGVFVAAGDVDGDGLADIVVGTGAGGGPQVSAFRGTDLSTLHSFFAYAPTFTGGVRVAAGDLDGDGYADIVTAPGAGGGPQVSAFSGVDGSTLASFFAYDPSVTSGVFVAAAPAVPEPATVGLLIVPVAGVLLRRRWRGC